MAQEEKAKVAVDRIMEQIIPVKEAAIAKAELLSSQGDGKAAHEALSAGLKEVARIINCEMTKHAFDVLVIEPLKEMLGMKQ